MYVLEVFAIAVATVGLALLLEETHCGEGKERFLAWSLYGLGVIAAMWSAYSAVWVPVASTLVHGWVLLTTRSKEHRWRFAREWVLIHGVIIIACIPIVLLLIHQLHGSNIVNWYTFSWYGLVGTFGTVFAGSAFVGSYARYIVYAIGLVMVILGLGGWIREPRWNVLVLSLGLVPIGGSILVSLAHPVFAPRTFLWTFLPLSLVLANGARVLRPGFLSLVALFSLVVVSLTGLTTYWRDRSEDILRGYDRAASLVASSAHPGDVLLVFVPFVQPTFDYYFRRYNIPLEEYGVPVTLGEGTRISPPLTPWDIPRIQRVLRGRHRVWFVWGMLPSAGLILDTLGSAGRLVSSHTVNEALRVYLYDLHD